VEEKNGEAIKSGAKVQSTRLQTTLSFTANRSRNVRFIAARKEETSSVEFKETRKKEKLLYDCGVRVNTNCIQEAQKGKQNQNRPLEKRDFLKTKGRGRRSETRK